MFLQHYCTYSRGQLVTLSIITCMLLLAVQNNEGNSRQKRVACTCACMESDQQCIISHAELTGGQRLHWSGMVSKLTPSIVTCILLEKRRKELIS